MTPSAPSSGARGLAQQPFEPRAVRSDTHPATRLVPPTSMPRTNFTSAARRRGGREERATASRTRSTLDPLHAGVVAEGAVLGAVRGAGPAPESRLPGPPWCRAPSGPKPCAGVVGPKTATTGVPTPVARWSGAESLVTSSAARSMTAADSRSESAPGGRVGPARRAPRPPARRAARRPRCRGPRPAGRAGPPVRHTAASAWCPRWSRARPPRTRRGDPALGEPGARRPARSASVRASATRAPARRRRAWPASARSRALSCTPLRAGHARRCRGTAPGLSAKPIRSGMCADKRQRRRPPRPVRQVDAGVPRVRRAGRPGGGSPPKPAVGAALVVADDPADRRVGSRSGRRRPAW